MTLERFCDWFLAQPVLARVPHAEPARWFDGVTGVTLYRDPPYQVQMFVLQPGVTIPEHTHPNVDSLEVYVGGDMRFTHGGKTITPPKHSMRAVKTGASRLRGLRIRVLPTDAHGGEAGPQGAVFFSVQQWLNGVAPSCVSRDYLGERIGPQHEAQA